MNEVTTIERGASAAALTASNSDPVAFIAQLALNPQIDEQKLRVLWDIQKDVLAEKRKEQAEAARVAYYGALAKAQEKFPIVDRDATNTQTHSQYARFETIWEACCPIWTEHGFSVSFPSSTTPEGNIRMVARIRHSAGHTEDITAPDAPPDGAGLRGTSNKTPIQANQSTVSYLKKGLLCSGFGIVTRHEDNDGNGGQRRQEDSRPSSGGMQSYVKSDDFNRPKAQTVSYPPKQEQKAPPPERKVEPQYSAPEDTWIGKAERKIVNAGETPKQVDAIGFVMARAGDLETIEAIKALPIVQRLAETPDNQTRIRTFEATARKRLGQTEKPVEPQQTYATGGFVATVDDPGTGEAISGPFTDEIEWAEAFLGEWEDKAPQAAKAFMRHHAQTILVARRNPEAAKLLVRIKALEEKA
jgi:hypothetical protein